MTTETPSSMETADLLDAIEHFLDGLEHAGQDAVLQEREGLRWKVAMVLDAHATKQDTDLRMLECKLELEALIRNPDVLVATANILYERLLKVAPQFP